VFVNPQVELETRDASVPVLDGKQFKSYLRSHSKDQPIPGALWKQLAEILAEEVVDEP
jgi:hypothetical protein